MSLRDKLIASSLTKEQYLEQIPKKKVKSSAYKATEYKVPDDPDRDVKEDFVLKECKEYLKTCQGLWWERIEAPVKIIGKGQVIPSASRGLPDLLLCIQGRLWGIELKRSRGGHLSGSQLSKLLSIAAAGGRSIVCQSARGLYRAMTGEQPRAKITTQYGNVDVF